jgi:predicted CoA-binding protein
MPLTRDEDIADLLQNARTIAMVGASDNPSRASFGVMKFLQDQGYRVIPVNPRITGEHVHGEYVWRELEQIGEPIDIVDVFVNSANAGAVVDEAIASGAKAVWMQLGVIDEEAARRAEEAGLKVVMDHCPKIEFARLGLRAVGEQA